MTMISMIAALDEQRGIGKNNQLLWHQPADLKYFKEMTLGKPIIMGRKTFDSIGKPLPGRTNIVLTTQSIEIPNTVVVSSIEEALAKAANVPEIMVVGGANIYRQFMPKAHRLYLTFIHHTFNATVFFPLIDEAVWRCKNRQFYAADEKNQYDMTFCMYERIKK